MNASVKTLQALEPRPLYGIGTVARLTGLKSDTLRVWERRYGLGASYKSPTGRRQYTQSDLDHLQLVSALVSKASGLARSQRRTARRRKCFWSNRIICRWRGPCRPRSRAWFFWARISVDGWMAIKAVSRAYRPCWPGRLLVTPWHRSALTRRATCWWCTAHL